MDADLASLNGRTCCRPRCPFPVAGVGEPYGLCARHGHEERNRRLAERDARATAPTVRPITRGLTTPPVTRPLSAVVGAPVVPTPIAPSACTAPEKTMPEPLTLRPNAGADPKQCRIDRCGTVSDARGLCKRHYAAARHAKRLEELAAPAQNVGNRRGPKPTPDSPITLRAERDQAREELARLRGDLERRIAEMEATVASHKSAADTADEVIAEARRQIAKLQHPIAWVNGLILRTKNADFDTMRVDVENALEDAEQNAATADALVKENNGLRDALARSTDKLQVVVAVLNLDPTADLAKQARDIAAWMGVVTDAANAFGVTSPNELKMAIDDAVTDTYLRPPAVSQPASQLYDLYQLGHVHRGPVRGYIDAAGLFRATDGAVYGAIFSAVPVTRPVLGEPKAGDAVWVRTSIAEVTPGGIYLDDGGRMAHGAWQPHRVRPAKAASPSPSATDDTDDIPF